MINKKFIYFFISSLFFSNLIFSQEYFNVKDILEKYYNYFVYLERKDPEFRIKEEINEFKEKIFVISSRNIKDMKIIEREKLNLEKKWIIEKLYFPKIYGVWEIFSPEPKIPRNYYKLNEEFDEGIFNKLLNIKVDGYSMDLSRSGMQDYHLGPFKINFNIEYYLFIDETIHQALKDSFESIIFRVLFLHDTSPLNSFDREIKIYGVVKEIR